MTRLTVEGLESEDGAQDLLGRVHCPRPGSRFHPAIVVGAVLDHSDRGHLMVGRLPQWMVRVNMLRTLKLRTRTCRPIAHRIITLRTNQTRLRLLIPVLVLLSGASSFAVPTGWTLHYLPARIVNGSPIVIRVTTPKPVSEITGKWLGHELAFTFDRPTKTWIALAGASLETKPGSYPIELHAKTAASQLISFTKQIPVQRQRYPRVVLKVPERYTAPSAEDQREIEQDKKTKEEAFKTLSRAREWSGSFAPPVTPKSPNPSASSAFSTAR